MRHCRSAKIGAGTAAIGSVDQSTKRQVFLGSSAMAPMHATSPVDVFQALNNSQSDSNVTVDCPVCGDGILQIESEECDDGGTDNGDGCPAACELEDGFGCQVPVGGRTVCRNRTCGDGIRVPGEDCDSGSSSFGCDSISCTILDGFACPVNDEFNGPSQCFNCRNGVLEFFEEIKVEKNFLKNKFF